MALLGRDIYILLLYTAIMCILLYFEFDYHVPNWFEPRPFRHAVGCSHSINKVIETLQWCGEPNWAVTSALKLTDHQEYVEDTDHH